MLAAALPILVGHFLIGFGLLSTPAAIGYVMSRARYRLYPWHRRLLVAMVILLSICGIVHINSALRDVVPQWWLVAWLAIGTAATLAFLVYLSKVGPLIVDERQAIIDRIRLSLDALPTLDAPDGMTTQQLLSQLDAVLGEPKA